MGIGQLPAAVIGVSSAQGKLLAGHNERDGLKADSGEACTAGEAFIGVDGGHAKPRAHALQPLCIEAFQRLLG